MYKLPIGALPEGKMAFGETQIEFEELPLGACRIDGAELTFDARFTGRATIEFSREAEWTITDIDIAAWRTGTPGKGESDYFSARKLSPAIHDAIDAALHANESDRIQNAITREFEGMGFVMRTDWDNGEKYFSGRRA